MINNLYEGESFIAANEKYRYHVIFTDIYLDGISGIEVARRFQSDRKCRFIFTTASTEHAIEAFHLNAVHYLVKPLSEELVEEALRRYISEQNFRNLNIRSGKKPAIIPMSDIVFVEVLYRL